MSLLTAIKHAIPDSTKQSVIRARYSFKRILKGQKKIQTKYEYRVFGKKGVHTYFGYYDICPFNGKNELVYLELDEKSNRANVILNNLAGTDRRQLASTNAWNWQQGCRLRWLPGSNDKIIFNDYVDGSYFSRILDVRNGEEKRLEYPLYDLSFDGACGITLDFNRLGYMRPGYGYTNIPFKKKGKELLKEGVQIVDIENGKVKETVTYSMIADAMGKEDYDTVSNWYLNHLSFSPDGSKFLFFFLEYLTDTTFSASMLCYDLASKDLKVLEKEYKTSHYTWLDNNTILCTAYDFSSGKVVCRYYSYDVISGKRTLYCPNCLQKDGHPSVFKEKEIITDTYPDAESFQTIYRVNSSSDTKEQIIKIFNRQSGTMEKRTDLHPRFNEDKSLICFDAKKGKYRKLYILNLK